MNLFIKTKLRKINKFYFINDRILKLLILFLFSLSFRILVFGTFVLSSPEKMVLQMSEATGGNPFYPPGYYIFYNLFISLDYGLAPGIIFQYAVDSFIAVLIVLISEIIFKKRYYFIGYLYSINLLTSLYASFYKPETLYALFIILSLYFILVYLKNNNNLFFFLSIISFCLSNYIRPNSLYMIPFISIIFLYKKQFYKFFIFNIIFILLISPNIIYNKVNYDELSFATIQEYNLYHYEMPVTMFIKEVGYITYFWEMIKPGGGYTYDLINKQTNELATKYNCLTNKEKVKISIKYIINNPIPWLYSHFVGIFQIYRPITHLHYVNTLLNITDYTYLLTPLIFITTIMPFLFIIFIIKYRKSIDRITLILILFIILFLSFIPGFLADIRFRITLEPLLYLFGGYVLLKFIILIKKFKINLHK